MEYQVVVSSGVPREEEFLGVVLHGKVSQGVVNQVMHKEGTTLQVGGQQVGDNMTHDKQDMWRAGS